MVRLRCQLVLALALVSSVVARTQEPDTLPVLVEGQSPENFIQMWNGFDPETEPLETEVLHQWEEDGVVLKIVRFRIGVFKHSKAILAAVYGYPKASVASGKRLPGLLQIHGGGQYADHKACVANAKRGYATVSIAWAGRISATAYRVTPKEVELFWNGDASNPNYRLTTDWGAVDGYHAPGRNKGNVFPNAKPASWTIDSVESPRNSGWFLCAMAARRAITFLQGQPEVDAERIGVYGHSMGGRLTVMAAVDDRVKAAAPSCGGISDRDNASPLFRSTLGDDVSLREISCPMMFLSPANDFHGRIGDLPQAVSEIDSPHWRVTCSPHHNHQDTAEYEVATMLWMDQHLKGAFQMPQTPSADLIIRTEDNVPVFSVTPDSSMPFESVDVFFTQQGKANETPQDRDETIHRYWHHARATPDGDAWSAKISIESLKRPLWVFANVKYSLPESVEGVGYYYGHYSADSFNLSSLLTQVPAERFKQSGVKPTKKTSVSIEDFSGDWKKGWFSYRPSEWAITTNKLNAERWKAPPNARLAIRVRCSEENKFVIRLDDFAAEVSVEGGNMWQAIELGLSDFRNFENEPLNDWHEVRQLELSPLERLRPQRRNGNESRVVGATWSGAEPEFAELKWAVR